MLGTELFNDSGLLKAKMTLLTILDKNRPHDD